MHTCLYACMLLRMQMYIGAHAKRINTHRHASSAVHMQVFTHAPTNTYASMYKYSVSRSIWARFKHTEGRRAYRSFNNYGQECGTQALPQYRSVQDVYSLSSVAACQLCEGPEEMAGREGVFEDSAACHQGVLESYAATYAYGCTGSAASVAAQPSRLAQCAVCIATKARASAAATQPGISGRYPPASRA